MPPVPNPNVRRDHATAAELIEFCNKVREAGGARPIEALMPGMAMDEHSCLIARALNFECRISPINVKAPAPLHSRRLTYDDGESKWFMHVHDEETLERISEHLDLPIEEHDGVTSFTVAGELLTRRERAILLPRRIGRAADAFDHNELDSSYYDEMFAPDGVYIDEDYL